MTRWILALLLAAATARAQGRAGCCGYGMGPISGAPVEVEGKVVQVRIAPGQGMPSIAVNTAEGERPILLGPLWYLMSQNFNPKVGDEVAAKVYKTANGWIAASVTVRNPKRTIRLRDDDGRPVWRAAHW